VRQSYAPVAQLSSSDLHANFPKIFPHAQPMRGVRFAQKKSGVPAHGAAERAPHAGAATAARPADAQQTVAAAGGTAASAARLPTHANPSPDRVHHARAPEVMESVVSSMR
jgi:hypothetical protein